MTNTGTDTDRAYLCSAITISDHPGNPLEGKVWALRSTREAETDIDGELLGRLFEYADERFNKGAYATGLRVGTVYFDAETRDAVGVSWEKRPQPHRESAFSDAVETVPTDMVPIEEF